MRINTEYPFVVAISWDGSSWYHIIDWCTEQFGPESPCSEGGCRYHHHPRLETWIRVGDTVSDRTLTFAFRNEEDAVKWKLKFG